MCHSSTPAKHGCAQMGSELSWGRPPTHGARGLPGGSRETTRTAPGVPGGGPVCPSRSGCSGARREGLIVSAVDADVEEVACASSSRERGQHGAALVGHLARGAHDVVRISVVASGPARARCQQDEPVTSARLLPTGVRATLCCWSRGGVLSSAPGSRHPPGPASRRRAARHSRAGRRGHPASEPRPRPRRRRAW